jgi:predicted AlkP superfamily pyrophosphatase or phosphodiesterase
MSNKLIVMMVDGVAAEHYAADRGRFPHFQALEARGFRVEHLHAEVLGTSLPGRTSMLTGATADVSGVYGNKIWDGEAFRYANPDDVRVPTLPARARAAGLRAAVIGFGMVRPEDADLMIAPWWVGTFVQRARDARPVPAEAPWLRVAMCQPDAAMIERFRQAGVPTALPAVDVSTDQGKTFFGILSDQVIADWVSVLAASPDAPDLILFEFLMTDTIQHYTGYKSELSQWITGQADAALGKIVQRLRAAGVLDSWNIAVMSDHGHSAVEKALHPGVIIPGVRVQCEGGSLLVAPRNAAELDEVTAKLAAFGVEPYPNRCIPPDFREQIAVFVAPPGYSFEDEMADATEPIVAPKAISTHGLRPGLPGDDRFALFAGPRVPAGRTHQADAVQVAPTLAAILGLDTSEFAAAPIFQPVLAEPMAR